jgi:preprotein translocase subunit SecG
VLTFPLIAAFGQTVMMFLLAGMAIFLILLVLVQRGRGGGLAGALGGMGGSSAFGAKAGDVFTRVTIVAAAFWIILCIIAANVGPSTDSRINTGTDSTAPADLNNGPALTGPATGEEESADAAGGETDGEPAPSDESASGEPASEVPAGDSAESGDQPQE